MKEGIEDINYNIKKELGVKYLISMTRNCLKKQFIWVHQKQEEQIFKNVKDELIKNIGEIKEESNEIDSYDSEN